MTRNCLIVLSFFFTFFICVPAAAQTAPSPDGINGLFASVSAGAADVTIGNVQARRAAWRLELGWRVESDKGFLHVVQFTPKLSLLATNFRGVDPAKQTFAYASIDVVLRTTVRAAERFRPFVEVSRGGPQTAEVPAAGGRILNYAGSGGPGWGVGLEIPLTKQGRGIEVGFRRVTGSYSRMEYQKNIVPAGLDHRATSVFVGWSGRFTGISLPWR